MIAGWKKLADCNHMKVLVFGGKSDGGYRTVCGCSFLSETNRTFPKKHLCVCVAEDPLALFETEEDLPQDLGRYLEQYLQNQESAGSGKLFKLGRLLDEKEKPYPADYAAISGNRRPYHLLKTMYRVPDDRFLYKQEK